MAAAAFSRAFSPGRPPAISPPARPRSPTSRSGSDRAAGMGRIGAGIGLGLVIGPVLGSTISHLHPNAPPLAAALLAFADFLGVLFLMPETRVRLTGEQIPRRRAPLARARSSTSPILAVMAIYFLTFICMTNVQVSLALLADARLGWTAVEVGHLFGLYGLMALIVQGGAIGKISRRFPSVNVLVAGTTAIGLGMATIGARALAAAAHRRGRARRARGRSHQPDAREPRVAARRHGATGRHPRVRAVGGRRRPHDRPGLERLPLRAPRRCGPVPFRRPRGDDLARGRAWRCDAGHPRPADRDRGRGEDRRGPIMKKDRLVLGRRHRFRPRGTARRSTPSRHSPTAPAAPSRRRRSSPTPRRWRRAGCTSSVSTCRTSSSARRRQAHRTATRRAGATSRTLLRRRARRLPSADAPTAAAWRRTSSPTACPARGSCCSPTRFTHPASRSACARHTSSASWRRCSSCRARAIRSPTRRCSRARSRKLPGATRHRLEGGDHGHKVAGRSGRRRRRRARRRDPALASTPLPGLTRFSRRLRLPDADPERRRRNARRPGPRRERRRARRREGPRRKTSRCRTCRSSPRSWCNSRRKYLSTADSSVRQVKWRSRSDR